MLLLIAGQLSAQPQVDWQKSYGGTRFERIHCLEPASDGHYFAAGFSASNNDDLVFHVGLEDCWFLKIDASGQILSQSIIGGSQEDAVNKIRATSDGGCLIACASSSDNVDFQDAPMNEYPIWIFKLDASLQIEWQRQIPTAWDGDVTLIQSPDGGFIIGCAYTDPVSGAGTRLTKLSANGSEEWQKDIHVQLYQTCLDMQATSDGGYILAGSIYEPATTGADWWVLKINASLEVQWEQFLKGMDFEEAQRVVQTANGEYLVAGTSSSSDGPFSNANGNKDVWVVRLSGSGAVIWKENYGGTKEDFLGDLVPVDADKFLLVAGSYSNDRDVSNNYGSSDFWLSEINGQGQMQWEFNFGGDGTDKPFDALLMPDNSLLMAGYTGSTSGDISDTHGGEDAWLIKTTKIE